MAHVVVIAGPNGAGKSTVAPYLLRDALGVSEFVNADTIAQGLSAYAPEKTAIAAGKIMLERLSKLGDSGVNFAFETTLSSKIFFKFISGLRSNGYQFTLMFLWLGNSDLAVSRVAERVRKGGHNIPTEDIKRRYTRATKNFFHFYRKIADNWYFYDNSHQLKPELIAKGKLSKTSKVFSPKLWHNIKNRYEKDK